MGRVYSVYEGRDDKDELVYIGTTVQKPSARFRWHKANGKPLRFKVLHQFDNPDKMLDKEFELIQKHKPRLNKIVNRKQNLNIKLSQQELDKRKGNKSWCQGCLKRRVRVNYKRCGCGKYY